MKLPIFMFVGHSINKNRIVLVWERYHNASIISIFTSICTLSITNLDIFRLGCVSSHSIGLELTDVDPFLASVPILYPLKTPGNQKPSGVFREYKMRVMAQNGLIKFIMQK